MDTTETNQKIIYLPIEEIVPNPFQPRKSFEREPLDELANSVREFGVIQPINVRLINGTSYELVAGERRLKASKIAGLKKIPAIVINITDQQSALIAIIENLQRENLNYIEEAQGFQNLIRDYSFTQEELAEKIGKSQSTIANKLRILRLPKSVQKSLLENDLTERHARALLRLEDENEQLEILEKIIKNNLNVKKTEELIDVILKTKEEVADDKLRNKPKIKRRFKDIRLFTNTIEQAIGIMNESGVDTNYTMTEVTDGYEILIKIKSE